MFDSTRVSSCVIRKCQQFVDHVSKATRGPVRSLE